jgi:arylsulfatase A-like enzyme
MKKAITRTIALLALAATAMADGKLTAGKPNILLIVADDMGYGDVGFHGCKDIPTPNLDALAASGVRFSNGYVSGPYCSPSRAGLMTGRYQQRFGHEFNPGMSNTGHGLPLSEVTIAERLKAAGYVTGLVGKWHLGSVPEMQPQKRGFDEFFGFLGGSRHYFDAALLPGTLAVKDAGKPAAQREQLRAALLRGNEEVKEMDYTTDAFGREAVAFIERHKAQPWFLYLAFNAVHIPLEVNDQRLAKFAAIDDEHRRAYAAMMLAMDENIGRVRKTLADSALEQNTLVILISDNGGSTTPTRTVNGSPSGSRNGSCNGPLRGRKGETLEGGIRVPFVVSWPGRFKPAVCEKPVIQLDLGATALAVAGVTAKPEWKLDAVNLLPTLDGSDAKPVHEALYWRFGQQMAVRAGDYKLVRYDPGNKTHGQPVTEAKLYNLAEDMGETKDLAATLPDKVKELQSMWEAWNQSNIAPLWGGQKSESDGPEPGAPPKKKKAK